MLHYVRIRNFALIESGELEFGPGFNVVTGESGAGKSILMAAIELLLGGRVDRGVIRTGADRCEVAGLLTVPEELRPRVGAMLDGAGIPFDCASGELQLRRVVTASSARNFVNDTPVSARLLGTVGGELIDLHGANEQLSLNVPARQLELLDRYAGVESERAECARLTTALETLDHEEEAFNRELPDPAEVDRLELQLEEIDRVHPAPGEDEELDGRFRLASNSRQVLETAAALTQALTEGEDSLADRLGAVYRRLQELARIDESMAAPLLTDCDAINESVTALSESVSQLSDRVELDPEALAPGARRGAVETGRGKPGTARGVRSPPGRTPEGAGAGRTRTFPGPQTAGGGICPDRPGKAGRDRLPPFHSRRGVFGHPAGADRNGPH